MVMLELTPKEADVIYDLILNAITMRGRKVIEAIAAAEEMMPRDVRQMLAGVGVRVKQRPGEIKLSRFKQEVEK